MLIGGPVVQMDVHRDHHILVGLEALQRLDRISLLPAVICQEVAEIEADAYLRPKLIAPAPVFLASLSYQGHEFL